MVKKGNQSIDLLKGEWTTLKVCGCGKKLPE